MGNILTSSLGKKIMMAALGLFLIVFLLIHLGINLLLVLFDDSRSFNIAANFMGTNIVIKIFEVVLFAAFILHILYGLILQIQNWIARPIGYKVVDSQRKSFFSKYMIHTAVIITIFLVIHLFDFYFRAKFGNEHVTILYDSIAYPDLASEVIDKFRIPGYVIFYIASFLFLGFHLWHGFQSAFQSLGFKRKNWLRTVQIIGYIYTCIIVAGFTAIPLIIYFNW